MALIALKSDDRNSSGTTGWYASNDAEQYTEESIKRWPQFFKSNGHFDRKASVSEIIHEFFSDKIAGKRYVEYINARGKGKRPYTVMKITQVGNTLNRKSKVKQTQLLDRLAAIPGGDIGYLSKDGNFLVYIY